MEGFGGRGLKFFIADPQVIKQRGAELGFIRRSGRGSRRMRKSLQNWLFLASSKNSCCVRIPCKTSEGCSSLGESIPHLLLLIFSVRPQIFLQDLVLSEHRFGYELLRAGEQELFSSRYEVFS